MHAEKKLIIHMSNHRDCESRLVSHQWSAHNGQIGTERGCPAPIAMGGLADVQISRHACKHPRVLPNAACFCPALGPVEHRDGIPSTTIITHPTHPTVTHSAGPAKRGQSSKDRHGEAGEDAPPASGKQILCNFAYRATSLIYCSNARRLQCFTLLLALLCVIAHLACRDSI